MRFPLHRLGLGQALRAPDMYRNTVKERGGMKAVGKVLAYLSVVLFCAALVLVLIALRG